MIKHHVFENEADLIEATERLLRDTLATPGNLMLSGGSTPYVVYNHLAANPCPVHPDRRLFLSDERMQPMDSEQNNAYNLMPMLHALDCEDRLIRVDTTQAIEQATERFATDLASMDAIDLGFLGMGSDGHTAGFFTVEHAGMKHGPLTLHTNRPDGMQGVSVSPVLFQRVKQIILLVAGESKRAVIETLQNQPESIPAGIALAGHPNVELWTDIRVS